MAKEDFCFTYYDGDALRDMSHMNRLERGAYNDIVLQQRKFGWLTLDRIKKILGKDFDEVWESVSVVLIFDEVEKKYYVDWLHASIAKMKAHAEHQANNGRKGAEAKAKRKQKSGEASPSLTQPSSESQPLEDGNGIVNEDEDVSGSELYGKSENFFHGDVPEDLIELSGRLISMPHADEWQDYVQEEIEKLGYTVKREQKCPYISKEGKKINGRIDLVAGDGERTIGIELDDRQPRLKSIRKVESYDCGMVLLRDPKPLHDIKATIPAKTMVANDTAEFKDYEYWTEDVINGKDRYFDTMLQKERLGSIDIEAYAKDYLALLAQYPRKAPPDQHRFRVALIGYVREKHKTGNTTPGTKSKLDEVDFSQFNK